MTVADLIYVLSGLPQNEQVVISEDIYVNGWISHTILKEVIAAHHLDEFCDNIICEFKSGVLLSTE